MSEDAKVPVVGVGRMDYERSGMEINVSLGAVVRQGNMIEALRRQVKALAEILREAVPEEESADWWCPTCQEWIGGGHVTYGECHETCGTHLTMPNNDAWRERARAALKEATPDA